MVASMKFELLAMAICCAVAFGGEFLLRALVGDWWPWFMIATVMAAQVIVMVIPDRHYAIVHLAEQARLGSR
jgi:hypothetical protein